MSQEMRLIVCAFDATDKADEVEQALEALDRRLETIKLGNIAIVEKTADGQVSFRETKDHRNVISQVTGMAAGAASWLVYAFAGSLGYQAGPAAYSCLTVLPDKSIACLFECGRTNAYETITLARFPLNWLEEAKASP